MGRLVRRRRGKTVTLVTGLPPGEPRAVAGELKRLCGSGGAVKEGTVEIQGDHRARITEHLDRATASRRRAAEDRPVCVAEAQGQHGGVPEIRGLTSRLGTGSPSTTSP